MMKVKPRVRLTIDSKYADKVFDEGFVISSSSGNANSASKLSDELKQSVNYLVNSMLGNYFEKKERGVQTELLDEAFSLVMNQKITSATPEIPQNKASDASVNIAVDDEITSSENTTTEENSENDKDDESESDIEIDRSLSFLPQLEN